MKLKTRHFGEIEVDDDKIVNFEDGLPGFEGVKRFILMAVNEEESPFSWLQSVEDCNLAFAVVNPFIIKSDYDINISDEIVESLEIESLEEVVVLAVVVVPEDISKMSMNLKAPLIINTRTNKGVQTILDTVGYGVRHYIMEELQGREVTVNAGSHKEEGAIHSHK